MKNDNQMKRFRISKLKRGKVKNLGLFEKIALKCTGFIDGKRSLPREDQTGDWVSPHIDREVHSYDEFSSGIWGHLQIVEEPAYAHLGELMDSIVHTRVLLEEAKDDLRKASEIEKMADKSRKHGESKLTEAQVATRRAAETAKRLAPFRARVSILQNKLASEIDEFSELRNRILEDNNSTRMICNRVKDHLHQRIDIYWNAALRKHPDNTKMPVVPGIELVSHAECVYMEPHELLMKKAELLSETFSDEEKEVA